MSTDARMGSDELHRPSLWGLSAEAFRAVTSARMHCAGAGTDGRLPAAYLPLLMPGGVPDEVAAEVVAAGHWTPADDGDGYHVDWTRQSTAEEVEAYRARKRVNQRRYRARLAEQARAQLAKTGPVTGNATGDGVTGHVGKARPGPHLAPVPSPPPPGGGGGEGTGTDLPAHTREEDRSRRQPPPTTSGRRDRRSKAERRRTAKGARATPKSRSTPAEPLRGNRETEVEANSEDREPAKQQASEPAPGHSKPRSPHKDGEPPTLPAGVTGPEFARATFRRLAAEGRMRLVPHPKSGRRPPDPAWRQPQLPLYLGVAEPPATSPDVPAADYAAATA